jgi:hypothetical protein
LEVEWRHRSKILAIGSRENQKGKHADSERPNPEISDTNSMPRLKPKSGKHHSWHGDRYGKKETNGFNVNFKTEARGKQVRMDKEAGLDVNFLGPKKHTLKMALDPSAQKKGRPTFRQKKSNTDNVGMLSGEVSSKTVSPLGRSSEKVLHPTFPIKNL